MPSRIILEEDVKSYTNHQLLDEYSAEMTRIAAGISGDKSIADFLAREILHRMSPVFERNSYTDSKYGDLGYANLSNQDLLDLYWINFASANLSNPRSLDGLTVEIIQRMEAGLLKTIK